MNQIEVVDLLSDTGGTCVRLKKALRGHDRGDLACACFADLCNGQSWSASTTLLNLLAFFLGGLLL